MTSQPFRMWNDRPPEEFGGNETAWTAAVVEQYKIYVDLTDRNSARRVQTNSYFALVCTALATGVVGLSKLDGGIPWVSAGALILIQALICAVWTRMIRSSRRLSRAKFEVIRRLEEKLPVSPWYQGEWVSELRQAGPNRSTVERYDQLTRIETVMAVMFGVLTTILIIAPKIV